MFIKLLTCYYRTSPHSDENRRQTSEEKLELSTRSQDQTSRASYSLRDPPNRLPQMREQNVRDDIDWELGKPTSAYDQGPNDCSGSRSQQTFSEPMQAADLPQPESTKPRSKRAPHPRPSDRTMQDYTSHRDRTGKYVPSIEDLNENGSQHLVATYGYEKDGAEASQALEDESKHDTQLAKPLFTHDTFGHSRRSLNKMSRQKKSSSIRKAFGI